MNMGNVCPKCRRPLSGERRGNVFFRRENIDVTLADTRFRACGPCGIAVLPRGVRALVERTLKEKKRIGGAPSLYIHVSELIAR